MTHVLVWKVYREQRSVWLAMAGLALAGLVLGAIFLDQGLNKSSLIALACGIAYINGLVVGALLLAGEREGGTAAFLEALPASRLAVWRGKCLGGGLLVLAQVLLLWALLLVMLPPQRSAYLLPAMLAACAIMGFGWGLLFSGRTQTPMGAVFAAVMGQVATMAVMIALWPMTFLKLLLFESRIRSTEASSLIFIGAIFLVAPFVLSAIRQARLDRLRYVAPGQAAAAWKGAKKMTGVLVWKVYREQRSVWLAMAGLALVVQVLGTTLFDQGASQSVRGSLFCLIAYIYGLVVGALLLAGESEGRTAGFLESVPAGHLAVWRAKVAAGCGLILAQTLFLAAILCGWRYLPDGELAVRFLTEAIVLAFLGFAWGLLFSDRAGTSFGAALGALLGQAAALPFFMGVAVAGTWSLSPDMSAEASLGFLLPFLVLLAIGGPIGVSGFRQIWLDRLRHVSLTGWRAQLAALVWLDLRHWGRLFLWLALAAPAAGFGLAFAIQYSPPVVGLQAWPALTLLLGVIGGVSIFGGKQREATGRVLVQQRLSPRVVWAVKVSLHLGLVAIVVVLLLLGALPALDFWARHSGGLRCTLATCTTWSRSSWWALTSRCLSSKDSAPAACAACFSPRRLLPGSSRFWEQRCSACCGCRRSWPAAFAPGSTWVCRSCWFSPPGCWCGGGPPVSLAQQPP